METYPTSIFLRARKPKSGPTYASFITINKHIVTKRPKKPPVGEDLNNLCKPCQPLRSEANIQKARQKRRLLEFLKKDAEEMLRRINMPATNATTSRPESQNKRTVSEYMGYLKDLYTP